MRRARTEDFAFDLPEALIAQSPLEPRDASRLLVLGRRGGALEHARMTDLPRWLRGGDLLVLNDTRVLPCRLFARRATGARIEFLLLGPQPASASGAGERWRALARPLRRTRVGEALVLEPAGPRDDPAAVAAVGRGGAGGPSAAGDDEGTPDAPAGAPVTVPGLPPGPGSNVLRVAAVLPEGEVVLSFEGPIAERHGARGVLGAMGAVPLPPYIRERLVDPERYQTVYARVEGSAAAPTAGLHFTPALLAAVSAAGVETASVTLHVGVGTFRPVTAERAEDHHMHREWLQVPDETAAAVDACRARGGRVVAVGTTVLRALEARAAPGGRVRPGETWTDLYILPGWRFQVVDGLLTNFHLPRSTLLMLVSAFAGRERVLAAYREAVRLRYRFYSLGDAMLVI